MMISIKRNNLIKAYSNYEIAIKEDDIDKAVGIIVNKKISDSVVKGDILAYVHANDEEKGIIAVEDIKRAYKIVKEKVEKPKYIIDII